MCEYLAATPRRAFKPGSRINKRTRQTRRPSIARVDTRKYEGAAERTCAVKQTFGIELKALRASDTSGWWFRKKPVCVLDLVG